VLSGRDSCAIVLHSPRFWKPSVFACVALYGAVARRLVGMASATTQPRRGRGHISPGVHPELAQHRISVLPLSMEAESPPRGRPAR
jgi:hypothetical protein